MAHINPDAVGVVELPSGRPPSGSSETACPSGWLTSTSRPSLCLLAGLLVGGLSALVSLGVGYLPSGHQLNDPLQLALAASAVLRRFRYFNWTSFGISVGASLVLGAASWIVLRSLARLRDRRVRTSEIDRASRAAALVSALPVLVHEVDALQVTLWYGLAVWFSMLLAGIGARALAHRWR